MKKILISTSVLLAFIVGAQAANLPLKAPAYVVAYNWNGFYVGGNVGYSWGRADTDPNVTSQTQVFRAFGLPAQTQLLDTGLVPVPLGSFRTNVDGWIGGLQAGWNWQHNSWVAGIEGDFQWSGQHGSNDFAVAFPAIVVPGVGVIPAGVATASTDFRLKWFGTLRGRLGVLPHERLLVYLTGGLAVGRLESSLNATLPGVGALASSSATTKTGWVAGIGAEGALWGNWTAKIEYLYMDLGSVGGPAVGAAAIIPNFPNQGFTTVQTFAADPTTRFTDHILRVGLNYRFAPVVARF
jgi:outer membrane immunogenic protein